MRFGNFLSYKDETVFYMTAAPLKEKNPDLQRFPIFNSPKGEDILKAAAVYGANGGGKSNVLKAFKFFADTVTADKQEDFWQNYRNAHSNPFLLNQNAKGNPTSIELSFVFNSIEYRYGFELLGKTIKQEWLFKTEERETKVFSREGQTFEINGEYKILKELDRNNMVREDALLLTVSAKFNELTARTILEYLNKYYFFDSFEFTSFLHGSNATRRLEEPQFLAKLLDLMKKADTGIENIQIRRERKSDTQSTGSSEFEALLNLFMAKQNIVSSRKVFDDSGNVVKLQEFVFSKFESEGTRKFFDVAAVAIEVLEKGGVLFIDEIDTKFHPLLTKNLIKLFYSQEGNPNNAQLVFTTHDSSLMESDLLRRDQIWLAEKDEFGVSHLTPLNEFKSEEGKGVRNDEAIGKNYLKGKYGAVPVLTGFY